MGPSAGVSRVASIVLLVVAATALLVRIVSIAEPLGIDQSLWASAVRGMARGQLLYRDVWEQRPPGIYFTYLWAFRIFGWTPAAVAWLDILASVATTALLYGIVSAIGTRTAAALAAALYSAFTMPGWLYRYDGFLERSVCETFIVVCAGLAAWCAVCLHEKRPAWAAFGVGLFAGTAVVFKPNAGLYLPAMLLWMFWYRSGAGTVRWIVRALVCAALGSLIAPALTLVWLWRLGLLGDARIAVVDFNRWYVGVGFTLGGYALAFSKAVWLRMKTDPIWLAGGVGALAVAWELVRRRRLDPLPALAVCWGAAAALVIMVNGAWLFNSYFIQAFAPLSVLAAWLLAAWSRGQTARRVIGLATVALMAAVLADRHYVSKVWEWTSAGYAVMSGRESRIDYLERFGSYANSRGYSARANQELADYIRTHTGTDERIFLFGINGAGVYFASDRLTAHRFLRVNFFVPGEFPDPRFRLDAVLSDLEARLPRYVIFERLNSKSDMGIAVDKLQLDPQVLQLLERYHLETQIEDFSLYRRIDATPAD